MDSLQSKENGPNISTGIEVYETQCIVSSVLTVVPPQSSLLPSDPASAAG